MITKEQYEYLLPQSRHFGEAKNKYLYGVYSKDVEYMKKIYNELGFEGPCKTCKYDIIAMYAKLGELFEDYKEEPEIKEEIKTKKKRNVKGESK